MRDGEGYSIMTMYGVSFDDHGTCKDDDQMHIKAHLLC